MLISDIAHSCKC